MKRNKLIGLLFTIASLVLVMICIFFYMQMDRTPPEFFVQAAEVIYTPELATEKLLEGITAHDNVNGDVTNRIVVEKVMENRGENTAVVFFAVSDEAGNVAKFSKVFPAVYSDQEQEVIGTAGYIEDLESVEPTQIVKETDGQEEKEIPEESPQPTVSPTPSPSPAPTHEPEPPADEEQAANQEEEQQSEEEPSSNIAPTLSLKTSQVKTRVGVTPAWVNLIQTLSDDKDSYETLFQKLKVSKYDVNKAGTYHVTVSTEDSDGNVSAEVPLTIIVE